MSGYPRHHPLARAVRGHLDDAGLVDAGARVLVACSGGLDSTVLLHLLRFADVRAGLGVHAAHFDHAMRAGSRADALWVKGLATAWRIPLVSGRATVPPRGEADARRLRYGFLADAAAKVSADLILTAHHADDQAETVLFRILRGTGVPGLAGIAQRRGSIVRPLLPFGRAALRDYALAYGVRWRIDPTNRALGYARNRIRHRLMPLLEELRPGAASRLARLATDAADVERVLGSVLAQAVADVLSEEGDVLVLAAPRLRVYDPWVRARVMRTAFQRRGIVAGRALTRAALALLEHGRSGAGLDVGRGIRLERSLDRLILRPTGPLPADQPLVIATPHGAGIARIGGREVRVEWGSAPHAGDERVALDAASLRWPLTVRGWRAGDRIRLASGSRKLKKLFLDRRLAREKRLRVPVVADAAGDVLWIAGVARAVSVEPRPGHATVHLAVWE